MKVAVSLNTGGYRSDYMISDAAFPQRVEAQKSAGDSAFAEMLGSRGSADIGSVNSSDTVQTSSEVGAVDKIGAAETTLDAALAPADAVIKDTVVEKVLNEFEKIDASALESVVIEQGAAIPEDTMELARAIVNGDIDIKDVPANRITFELLKALLIARFEKRLKDDERAEDPKEKSNDQINTSAQVDAQLAILYKLIDAYTEMRYDDDTDTTGVMRRIREVAELLDEKGHNAELTDILAQILNDRIEAASAEKNLDKFDKSDELIADNEPESPIDEFLREIGKLLGEDSAKVLEEAVKNGDIGEITKAVKQIAEAAVKSETSGVEVKASVQSAVSEELEMLRSAKLAHAKELDDTQEFKAVKTGAEQAELPDTAVKAAVKTEDAGTAKQDFDGTQNGASQGAAMAAGTPIVFKTEDGAEFEVQPAEVVSQTMRLVEQAIQDTTDREEYSLILNPGELGRITVRMVKAADGAVSVTIAAENSRTQRILEENSSLMQSNLRNNGVQLESWQTVGESRQETLAQDYNGSSRNPYYREEQNTEEQEPEESFADIIAAM